MLRTARAAREVSVSLCAREEVMPAIVNFDRLLHSGIEENRMDDRFNDREDHLRDRAYRIWIEEGCPEGQAERHWQLAGELLAIEENAKAALKPRDAGTGPFGEPVESGVGIDSHGEVPGLTDQGDKQLRVPEGKRR
jgi:Protein of unknown function (DUF2934)